MMSYAPFSLQNMVGPGEVDDELEPETAEECSKYGKVIKCVIFEVSAAGRRGLGADLNSTLRVIRPKYE